jgi:hypothetical protein
MQPSDHAAGISLNVDAICEPSCVVPSQETASAADLREPGSNTNNSLHSGLDANHPRAGADRPLRPRQ